MRDFTFDIEKDSDRNGRGRRHLAVILPAVMVTIKTKIIRNNNDNNNNNNDKKQQNHSQRCNKFFDKRELKKNNKYLSRVATEPSTQIQIQMP